MPERVTPADPGLLASVADEIALPGYALRNVLKGNLGGAARNVADLGLNLIDAPLPGDWIPEISGAEDRPEFKDVVGPIDEGPVGSILNFAGDVATDPLTYLPPAWLAKGAGLAAKGVKAVTPKVIQEGVAKVAKPVGKTLRRTFGAEIIGKPLKDVITRAQGAKETAARASQEPIVEGLKGATPRELEAAGEVLTNITKDKATGALRAIDESDTMSVQDRLARYLTDNPDVSPDKLTQIVNTSQEVGRGQWASGQAGNIFTDVGRQPTSDVVMGALSGTTAREGIKEYFPRVFKNEGVEDLANRLGQPSAIKGRKLDTTKDVLEYLAQNPDVSLTTNVAEVLGKRAGAQGELAARGATGQGLMEMARAGDIALPDELLAKALPLSGVKSDVNAMMAGTARAPAAAERVSGSTGDVVMGGAQQEAKAPTGLSDSQRKQARDWLLSQQYKQADPLLRETAEAIAKNLPGDEADVALHMLKGMEKRGAVTGALSSLNRYFKPYAVYGAVIPKLGSITRNLTGGLWQQFSNAEARGSVGQAALRLVPTWLKSVEDGVERLIGKRLFSKNEFAEVDSAFKQAAGDPRKALAYIKDKDMRAAVERGVLGNNFVDTEQLIKSTSRGGWKALGGNILDYPGDMFKGAEQRMRYGLFKDLLKRGKSADDAARVVRESFYDYGISSAENRTVRDIIPFAQFMGKAVPQQAKLFAEKPYLASGVANLYAQGRDEPVSPAMEGKVNIPIGLDEQGNRQYLSNLGLPFEALSVLPNLSASPLQTGRDIEQNIVGATQPLLKSAYSYISGRDPYFGSMPGSYSKVAGQDLGTAGSTLNQLLNTGVPFSSAITAPLTVAGKLADQRTNLGESVLNQLTGARIQSVDPNVAIQQRLQAYLERDPTIGQFRKFYDKGGDIDAQQLLQNLQETRKALKAKQKAMANVN